ncbi:hypothetical protein EVAR_60942_1 [Eumeta japonica]|uniref:Uncharacterized protein n=1 Tax=Eumeta variegata TaxID=151549 RepID=A0A4C1XXI7_EUMVA|nr:hypothetical protein EVAR_60942_1 [Eumeta japonica]
MGNIYADGPAPTALLALLALATGLQHYDIGKERYQEKIPYLARPESESQAGPRPVSRMKEHDIESRTGIRTKNGTTIGILITGGKSWIPEIQKVRHRTCPTCHDCGVWRGVQYGEIICEYADS